MLARAAFDSVLEPGRVEVSEVESELPRPNYSIQTLKHLQKYYSDQRIALMMGLDQFKVFHRWKDPGAILGLCDLLVMRRDSGESLVKAADFTARHLGLKVEWSADHKSACFNNESGARLFMLDFKTSNAASSEIKFRLRLKKPIPESWVPTQVMELISSGQLYENVPREDKC
jgi:nicotinate-nucleotide adenylyltransferase